MLVVEQDGPGVVLTPITPPKAPPPPPPAGGGGAATLAATQPSSAPIGRAGTGHGLVDPGSNTIPGRSPGQTMPPPPPPTPPAPTPAPTPTPTPTPPIGPTQPRPPGTGHGAVDPGSNTILGHSLGASPVTPVAPTPPSGRTSGGSSSVAIDGAHSIENATRQAAAFPYSGWARGLLSISAPTFIQASEPAPGALGSTSQSWSLSAGAFLKSTRVAPVLNKWTINLDFVYNALQLTAAGSDADFVVQYKFAFGLGSIPAAEYFPRGREPGSFTIEYPTKMTASVRLTTQPLPYEMKPTYLIINIGIIQHGDGAKLPLFSGTEEIPITMYKGARSAASPPGH